MHIAIIGTGRVARGVGYGLRDSAHELTFGSRDAARAEALARAMADEHGRRYHGTGQAAAAARADLVVLAVPWSAALATVALLRDALDGKLLVDPTNPLSPTYDGLVTAPGTSASEEIAHAAGPRVRVVAALKHTFAATYAEPGLGGGPAPDVLVASDDDDARAVVCHLARAMGFGALEAGPLAVARTLESMTVLLLALAERHRFGAGAGWKLVHG